ncbi:hypothetical protein A8B78_08040 [Jannaschia sp. EhC01]|nr:hypothetical protein A8B78_08040 [Jannaschia sp. EhC01]
MKVFLSKMVLTISDLLQSYLYHRDNERRLDERFIKKTAEDSSPNYEWPDLHNEIQGLWAEEVMQFKALRQAMDKGGDAADMEEHIATHGCLRYIVDGRSFWVPSALAGFVPSPMILSSLFDTANECRHFEDGESRMCLSGSSVLMGEVEMVGDLDLFEYVPQKAVRKALKQDRAKYETGDTICTKVSVGPTHNGKWPRSHLEKRSKTDLNQKKMRIYAAKLLDRFDFCKIDMIGRFNDQVGEITNILFKHEDDFDFKGPFPSFAFQEVVVGDVPPPKEAFSLKNFGEFLFWLRDEIEDGLVIIEEAKSADNFSTDDDAQDKAIKVSKRALMLALLTNQKDLLESFKNALQARESQNYALQSSIDCLNPLIRGGDNGDEDLATSALEWVTAKRKSITQSPPPTLDIENLVSSLHNVLASFDRLCYPSLPVREETE